MSNYVLYSLRSCAVRANGLWGSESTLVWPQRNDAGK